MEQRTEITRTQKKVGWWRSTCFQRGGSHDVPYTKYAHITFRCLAVAGIIAVVIILMGLHQSVSKTISHFKQSMHSTSTDYVVYSPSCKIPDYPKFNAESLEYYKKVRARNCSSKPLLTSVSRSSINSAYVLQLNGSFVSHYVKNGSRLMCCYSVIHIENENYTFGECQAFETNVTLTASADSVSVTCQNDSHSTVYEMHHFLVPIKDDVRHKIETFHNEGHRNDEYLSVMLVGLDSVSRLNLLRTMPKTVKYIKHKGWYAFPAYHKNDFFNTFGSLVGPVLTGHTADQLKESCWYENNIDECPYIWKNFSGRDYITAFGEGGPWLSGCFKWYYTGETAVFKKQPTNYYLATHMDLAKDALGYSVGQESICVGRQPEDDYLLDFSAHFASSFVDYPTFSLFWVNSGHDQMNHPQVLDERFVSYFSSLEESGVLNKSMVVFLSDHGFMMDAFVGTHMGYVEYSMPFLYIWLPKWFKDKYPTKVRNLEVNKDRLVTHMDLHVTLLDVLGVKSVAAGCPKCGSLFNRVVWDRACSDAGISKDVCVCDAEYRESYEDVVVDSSATRMAESAVARINALAANYTEYVKKGYKCARITLKEVYRVKREPFRLLNAFNFARKNAIYFYTAPNAANYVAEVTDKLEVKTLIELTLYEKRSFCMRSREGKQWCTCEKVRA